MPGEEWLISLRFDLTGQNFINGFPPSPPMCYIPGCGNVTETRCVSDLGDAAQVSDQLDLSKCP